MKKFLLMLTFSSLIGGCAPLKPLNNFDGKNLTFEHGTGSFPNAMVRAQEICNSVNKTVKHERTDCPYRCVSTFTCEVKK
jgi:hypothetical protein